MLLYYFICHKYLKRNGPLQRETDVLLCLHLNICMSDQLIWPLFLALKCDIVCLCNFPHDILEILTRTGCQLHKIKRACRKGPTAASLQYSNVLEDSTMKFPGGCLSSNMYLTNTEFQLLSILKLKSANLEPFKKGKSEN